MKFKLKNRLIVVRSPFEVYSLPDKATWGITNRTLDNYFVVFGDYDSVEYSVVKEDVDFLQKNFDVGAVMTRVSSYQTYKDEEVGNYHLITFTKGYFDEINRTISHLRCDTEFKRGYQFQQRCLVLRIGRKLDFYGIPKKPETILREIIKARTKKTANLGLIRFFEQLDRIRLKSLFEKKDSIRDVELIKYPTR